MEEKMKVFQSTFQEFLIQIKRGFTYIQQLYKKLAESISKRIPKRIILRIILAFDMKEPEEKSKVQLQ